MAVPFGVETEIIPLDPVPRTANIVSGDITVNDAAGVPPNNTEDTLLKFVPVMVMIDPLLPLIGVKAYMIGPLNVNPARLPVPKLFETVTVPLAPEPTTAVIPVAESMV